MLGRWLLYTILSTFCVATCAGQKDPAAARQLVNALVGVYNNSAVQCWSIDPPFTISAQAGTVGAKIQSIGDISGGTIVFFNETDLTHAGLHPAPSPQWVLVLQGNGVVTLPATNATLDLPSGTVIIANDTQEVSGVGHNTEWAAGSVAVQLPFKGGVAPNHTVVNDGPCRCSESRSNTQSCALRS
ncbi:hypothetical protein K439DRAFT_1409710 [Ramaria rubella]|nr:hypothetical protein K439DRAFT_1409710 [Ramaria rubella]